MKKFLSLVLALVMTMSLVTISAGAKDFTDDSKITYAEAVDVISAVKVVDGYTDGSFNPTATLTRGAAAKIICNLILGPTTASALVADAAPYKDVPADSTFAGYIAFCAKEGIIDGYTDGTFRPGHSLTGYAFMKLLLGALGYDKDVEGYNGTNWSINVAKRALNLGLDDGLTENFNGVKPVTREEACLYALNTMKATMVQYDSKTTVSVGGAEVVIAGSKAEDVENKLAADNTIYADGKMQFAEKYFTNLKLDDDARDDFGRPANEWKNKTSKIGLYVKTADATYTKEVEKGDIYADLGLSKSQTTDEYAINGKAQPAEVVSKKNEDKVGVGNGVLTQVWYDDDAEYLVITSIVTYVGKVNSVTKATGSADRYVTVAPYTAKPGTMNTKFETEDFAAKDVVAYTAAWNSTTSRYDIKTVKLLENPATGTLTEWNGKTYGTTTGKSENNFTVAGETYKYSKAAIVVDENGAESAVWNFEVDEAELNVYVDEYGYALFVDGVEAEKKYAAVIGVGSTNPYGDQTTGVTLLLPDGTKKTVTAKLPKDSLGNDLLTTPNVNLVNEPIADLVTYTVDDDGVYKLTVQDNYATTDSNGTTIVGVSAPNTPYVKFVNGKSLLTIGADTYYTTSDTVFMVCTDDGTNKAYNVYTGYANMPSTDDAIGIKAYAVKTNSDYTTQVDVVYIYAAKLAGISDVDTYFVKKKNADIITNSDGSYYVLPAIVDGEETTVKVDATISDIDDNANDKGVWAINNVTKNSKGIITSYNKVNSTVFNAANTATGTVAANRVVLGLGGSGNKNNATYWAYNDKTQVFVVDEDYKTIAISSVAAVANDANDEVYASHDTNTKVLKDVIVVEKKDVTRSNDATFTINSVKGNTAPKTTGLETGVDAEYTLTNAQHTDTTNWKVIDITKGDSNATVTVMAGYALNNLAYNWTSVYDTKAALTDPNAVYVKITVTAQDTVTVESKVIKIIADASEVLPVLNADANATAVTAIDTAGASAKIKLANGTSCTAADLKAVLSTVNATSMKLMTVGALGAWVEADGSETINGSTEANFKVVVVSNEGVTYTWTIDVL